MAGNQRITVVGTCAVDTKGRAQSAILPGTASPGTIRVSVGGVGRNIAENLARLGVAVTLVSAVGDDAGGRYILHHTAQAGIDITAVQISPDYHTGAYMTAADAAGQPILSISDTEIMQSVTPDYVYQHRVCLNEAALIVIDANLPPDTLETVVRLARSYKVPVCADPTSVALSQRLIPHLPGLYMVTPNALEAAALCGCGPEDAEEREVATVAANQLVQMGVGLALVTLGERGVVYATPEVSGHIPAIRSEVVDLTGAGDALTAGSVFGILNDMPVDEAVWLGAAAAALTLQSHDTVNPELSLERLYDLEF